jgi:transcriptional regulator with XRE-family HTH domain
VSEKVDEVAKRVGQKVCEIRRERGWIQQELASAVPATVQWISHVERGLQNLNLASMVRLANALGVPVVELLMPPKAPRKSRLGRGRPKKI